MAKETDKQKECFIIMPITVPEHLLDKYRDGNDHFQHVLSSLFFPAVKGAGYKPVPPKASGSDLVHAHIIGNLETADLILCDMSALNANVFFEFGIRTALDKPVCVVKDELTKAPFDAAILNYDDYFSSLDGWKQEAQIKKLTEHINKSAELSKGHNTLWKNFGLKSEATPYEAESTSDAKLDYLQLQLESIANKLDETRVTKSGYKPLFESYEDSLRMVIDDLLLRITLLLEGATILSHQFDPETKSLVIHTDNPIDEPLKRNLINIAARENIKLVVRYVFPREHS